MKCLVITRSGGPEVLELQERPVPVPAADQVLIRVRFSGINRPDIFQRKGNYPAPAGVVPDIPGLEVSGVVVACGAEVISWKPGDRVCALLAGGGYAEYALAHQGHCLPLEHINKLRVGGGDRKDDVGGDGSVSGISDSSVEVTDGSGGEISDESGAALPETLFTVWHNVFQSRTLRPGHKLLVHGGSGGIGTTAIQLARLFGIQVYTTAGSDDRCRLCEELGAEECVNYRSRDFAEHWSGLSVDMVLDIIGGDYFAKNLRLLAPGGRLVQINCIGGRKVELDLLRLMQHRHQITGSTLRSRDNPVKEEIRDSILQRVWPLVGTGQFNPVIDRILPFEAASEAHHLLESGQVFGKLLLKWD